MTGRTRSNVAVGRRRGGLSGSGNPSLVGGGIKLIGTHYFVPYPPSFRDYPTPHLDTGGYYDFGYIDPNGEGGQHKAYGGKLRDRPWPAADVLPAGTTQWECWMHDQRREVRDLIAAGHNTTFVDLLAFSDFNSREWQLIKAHQQATYEIDPTFRAVPMPDMTGGLGVSCTPQQLANALVDYASRPSNAFIDGRLLVAPFTPETRDDAFWNETERICTAAAVRIYWLWCVQHWNSKVNASDPVNNVDRFAGKANTWGMTAWGDNSPPGAVGTRFRGDDTHSRGLRWIQTIRAQDQRPPFGLFDEAEGTRLLREYWISARQTNADGVQFITWNDPSEATHLMPSRYNATSWVELNKLQQQWFLAGSPPVLQRDFACLVHRPMHTQSVPSLPQTLRMSLRGGSAPVVNIVEGYTWLASPGTVTLTVPGQTPVTYAAPAGEFFRQVPFPLGTNGRPRLQVTHGAAQSIDLLSRDPISNAPVVEDFSYRATHAYDA